MRTWVRHLDSNQILFLDLPVADHYAANVLAFRRMREHLRALGIPYHSLNILIAVFTDETQC